MKAVLVMTSFVTRVIVPDDADEEYTLLSAKRKHITSVENDFTSNIEEIIDDLECPYDPETDLLTSHY